LKAFNNQKQLDSTVPENIIGPASLALLNDATNPALRIKQVKNDDKNTIKGC
jgi:hypothetical protein